MYSTYYSPAKYNTHTKIQMPKKWAQDIQLVIKSPHSHKGCLYISNIEAAQNLQTLKKRGIKAILSCAKGYNVSHPPSQIVHYKYVTAQDKDQYDLTPHFDQCGQFIKKALDQTNILVHCIAGVSRSVSMVLAYLMKYKGMGYDQAYNYVKARRKIINPNDGFVSQLKKYHSKINENQNSKSKSPQKQRQRQKHKIQVISPYPNAYNKSAQKDRRSQYLKNYDNYGKYDNYNVLKRNYDNHYKDYKGISLTHQKNYNDFKRTNTYDSPVSNPNLKKHYSYGISDRKQYAPKSMQKIKIDYDSNFQKPKNVQIKNYDELKKDKQFISYKSTNNIDHYNTPQKKTYDLNYQDGYKFTRTATINDKIKHHTINNAEKPSQHKTSNRKGYFDVMNQELDQKIKAIRQKYEKQRQELINNKSVNINESLTEKIQISQQPLSQLDSQDYHSTTLNNENNIINGRKQQEKGLYSQVIPRNRGYSAKIPQKYFYENIKANRQDIRDVNSRYQQFLKDKFDVRSDLFKKRDYLGNFHNHYNNYGYSKRPLY